MKPKRLEWQADKKGYDGVGVACRFEDVECIVVCESLGQLKELFKIINPKLSLPKEMAQNVYVVKNKL